MFGLSRTVEADIDKLLEDDPVELEHVYGVNRGRKIYGVGVLLYDIVNDPVARAGRDNCRHN